MHTVIRETWLSKRILPSSSLIAALSVLLLTLGSLIYSRNISDLAQFMAVSQEKIASGELWRLWTAIFAHADEKHLLSNVFLFFILGTVLTNYFGLVTFPVVAFLAGGLINAFAVATMAPTTTLIGASGVVFWMGGAWLVLYGLLDRRRSVMQRMLRAVGVGLLLFMPSEAFDPSTSYRTHLIGFLIGAAWGLIYFLWKRKEFRSGEVIEVILEEPEEPLRFQSTT